MLKLWVIYTLQTLGASVAGDMLGIDTQGEENSMGKKNLTIDMCLGNQTIPIEYENETDFETQIEKLKLNDRRLVA